MEDSINISVEISPETMSNIAFYNPKKLSVHELDYIKREIEGLFESFEGIVVQMEVVWVEVVVEFFRKV